jgi:hypothetical protein
VHEKPPVDALLVAQQVAGWPHVTHEEPTKHNNARSHLYRHLSYSRIFHLATLDAKNCKAQIFINILDRSLQRCKGLQIDMNTPTTLQFISCISLLLVESCIHFFSSNLRTWLNERLF